MDENNFRQQPEPQIPVTPTPPTLAPVLAPQSTTPPPIGYEQAVPIEDGARKFGVISIAISWLVPLVSFILALIGINKSSKYQRTTGRKSAGGTTSIIGLVLSVVFGLAQVLVIPVVVLEYIYRSEIEGTWSCSTILATTSRYTFGSNGKYTVHRPNESIDVSGKYSVTPMTVREGYENVYDGVMRVFVPDSSVDMIMDVDLISDSGKESKVTVNVLSAKDGKMLVIIDPTSVIDIEVCSRGDRAPKPINTKETPADDGRMSIWSMSIGADKPTGRSFQI